jgi:hypothetical protein
MREMTGRNRIGKDDKFGLQLIRVETWLILDGVASLPLQALGEVKIR